MRKVSGMRRKNGATDDASGGNTKAGHLSGKGTWVGTSVRRREDPRLLTGRGRYIDDLTAPGMLHAQFVRSTELMPESCRWICPKFGRFRVSLQPLLRRTWISVT